MSKKDTITTKFAADVSDFKKGITTANQQIKLANSEFKKATAGMDDWKKSTDGITAKMNQLQSVLAAQNSKLESYQKQLDKAQEYERNAKDNIEALKRALQSANDEYGENAQQVKLLERQLSDAEKAEERMSAEVNRLTITCNNQEAAVRSTEHEMDSLGNELQQVAEAERKATEEADGLEDGFKDAGEAAEKTNGGFTVMKAALADLVSTGIRLAIDALKEFTAEAIKTGMGFDASMSEVQAISGATGEQFDMLRSKALQMGSSTKFTATEAADAFKYMAMAGWETSDMMSGIDGILSLAAASGEDLATTSDIVTDALTAFGYEAKDAGRFADVLAATSVSANTNVGMMGETFKYVAPIAGTLGYSMEDVALATGLMANAGVKGEQAGTSLRAIMTRLSTDTDGCATMLEEMGVQVKNSSGEMLPLASVMEQVREKMSGMSDEEKVLAAKSIAGQNALSGFTAILNASESDWEKMSEAINSANGAAEDVATTMQDNLQGVLTKIGSQVEGLQIQLFDKLSPALRGVAGDISGLLDRAAEAMSSGDFSKVAPRIKRLVVDGVKTVLNELPKIIDGLATMIPDVLQFLLKLINTIVSKLPSIATALINVIPDLVTNIVTTLMESVPQLLEGAMNLFLSIADAIPALVDKLEKDLPIIVESIIGALMKGETAIIRGATKVFSSIVKAVPALITAFYKVMPEIYATIAETMLDSSDVFIDAFTEMFDAVVTGLPEIIEALVDAMPIIVDSLSDTLVKSEPKLREGFSKLFGAITRSIPKLIASLTVSNATIVKTFQKTWAYIKGVWDDVKPYFTAIFEAIKNTFSKAKEIIGKYFSDAVDSVKVGWNTIGDFFAQKWQNIKDTFSGVAGFFRDVFTNAWNNVKNAFGNWVSFFDGLWNSIKGKFQTIGTAVGDAVGGAIKTVINQVIAQAETHLNNAINLLNGAIHIINGLPGVSIKDIERLRLPRLARGGVLDSGARAVIAGEAGAEAIVPLENNAKWISRVANEMVKQLSSVGKNSNIATAMSTNTNNFTQNIYAPQQPSRIELYRQTKNLLELKGAF